MTTERRVVESQFETRELANNQAIISGYGAVFNRDSLPLFDWNKGVFIEQFREGSFTKTIKEADVRGLMNHKNHFVIGRTRSGTLRLSQDSTGLHYELDADLGNTDVNNLYRMIARGDVSESSIGFRVPTGKDDWDYEQEPIRRSVREAALVDVSPVVFAAYPDTTSATREAFRGLARVSERPLDELVAAAKRGELRSYLHTTPGDIEPAAETEEPQPHSEDRGDHSNRPDNLHVVLAKIVTGAA